MSITLLTVLMLATIFIMIMAGYPIALVLGGTGFLYGMIFAGPGFASVLSLRIIAVFTDYTLVAVLLFTLMGAIIEKSGLAERLFDSMYVIFGKLNGGLLVATVVTCTIFAAATGVIGAAVVTMGLIALPNMIKYNYDLPLATGAICAGGTLGILIPPSVMILLYAPMAQLSVGRLLLAAFIPGITLSIIYIIYILIVCKLDPSKGPGVPADQLNVSLTTKLKLFFSSVFPVTALILAVMGSIFFGITGATEASGIGCLGALLLAAAYRKLTLQTVKEFIYQTAKVCGMVFLVVVGANVFTSAFLRLGCSAVVENLLTNLPLPPWGILSVMFLIVFIMGAFIDWIGILMIVVPLFTPVAANLGYDSIWFAMMVIVVMQTSFLTPPFAYAIFYLKGIAPPEVKTTHIYKGVIPFILLQIVGIIVMWIFPQIITFLPQLMMG